MQASSEVPVLEEHQINDPPLTSQQVHLCIAFFVRLCITFFDLSTKSVTHLFPPNVHVCLDFFEKVIVPPCNIVLFVHASMFLMHPFIC